MVFHHGKAPHFYLSPVKKSNQLGWWIDIHLHYGISLEVTLLKNNSAQFEQE